MRISFKSSLRVKLLMTFILCIIAALLFVAVSMNIYRNNYTGKYDYNEGIREVQAYNKTIVRYIYDNKARLFASSPSTKFVKDIEDSVSYCNIKEFRLRFFIVDSKGKVILKASNTSMEEVRKLNPLQAGNNYIDNGKGASINIFPIKNKYNRFFIVTCAETRRTKGTDGGITIEFISGIIFFMVLYYFITNRKIKYIEELADGLKQISAVKLDYRVKVKGKDELASLAASINLMAERLKENIEKENAAEKTKAELITNMSHDLRTPLTSVLGYLRLVVDKKYENEEEMNKYIGRAYEKSERLKILIEDLFEYTKSNTTEIPLVKREICINELLIQLIEDYTQMARENDIIILKEIARERIIVNVDSAKFVRVIENLLINAIRYSHKPSSVTVKLDKSPDGKAVIGVQNYGEPISDEDMNRLFEKFYRIEKSRSSDTGGSGLGLAIAYNIVKLHGGRIWAEQKDEAICFYVEI